MDYLYLTSFEQVMMAGLKQQTVIKLPFVLCLVRWNHSFVYDLTWWTQGKYVCLVLA
jgi:hypothetical protein